jgi:hypothetical protein
VDNSRARVFGPVSYFLRSPPISSLWPQLHHEPRSSRWTDATPWGSTVGCRAAAEGTLDNQGGIFHGTCFLSFARRGSAEHLVWRSERMTRRQQENGSEHMRDLRV